MKFREFYTESEFTFLHEGSVNWDYYLMRYKNGTTVVVSLAKPGSGAEDCFFGSMKYYEEKRAAGLI